jgi:hypothetical protein
MLVLGGICLLLAAKWQVVMVHASQETGTSNSASRAYDFWSGFGSDLGEYAIATGLVTCLVTGLRHRNCATRGCWRLTSHTVKDDQGVEYRRCHHHHPGIPDEHSHHGILRNHMSDEHLARVDAQHVARASLSEADAQK